MQNEYQTNQLKMKNMVTLLSLLDERIDELNLIIEKRTNNAADYMTSYRTLLFNQDFKREVQAFLLVGSKCQ